jgi:trehalose 6-phosphate phosphatase
MIRRPTIPAHLFHHWPRVEDRLRESKRVVLFLDFDGTLVPIQSDRKILFQYESRNVLLRLAENPRVTVVAISGRRRAELRRLMGIRGVQYFGLYGSENGRMPSLSPHVKKALCEAYVVIRNELSKYSGIWLENKVACFSVHFRETEAIVHGRVLRSVRTLLNPYRQDLHLFENLRDIEVVPRTTRGKGLAVRQVLDSRLNPHALPMYFGDDISDEPAFAELRTERGNRPHAVPRSEIPSGITVLVGEPRRTHAQFLLRNPKEVIEALSRIEEALV